MADLINDRKGDNSPIFRAHVERTLKQRAKKMNEKQSGGYSRFSDPAFKGRTYITDGENLQYTHSALYRFVDMKRLRRRGGYEKSGPKYARKNVYDFHNRIIMGHYNGIQKDLIYGAGEEVVNDMKAKFDGHQI